MRTEIPVIRVCVNIRKIIFRNDEGRSLLGVAFILLEEMVKHGKAV
mgnify:FL=1